MDLSIAAFLTQDGVTNGAIYALLALALVLVFTVTRIIWIPSGEFVAYGTLTLAGANTYTGATTINAGTLQLGGAGSITSNVSVNANGTLAGTGTVAGSVTAAAGGVVAPGSAGVGGVLNAGNTTLPSGSTLEVTLNTTSSRLNATGAVGIDGSTLEGSIAAGFTPVIGTPISIINTTGPWSMPK